MDVSRAKTKHVRLAVLVVALLAIFTLLPVTARAEIASGESGTVKWSISNDGELVFTPENGVDGTFGQDLRENDDQGTYRQHAWTQYISDIKSVAFRGTCRANGSLASMFAANNVSTNYSGTLAQCFSDSTIEKIDLSGLDTEKASSMAYMFYGNGYLESLDLSSLNTSNVTSMAYMFYGCDSLSNIGLASLNTASVTDMSSMFSGCSSLSELDLSSFNTARVTNMNSMFSNCSYLNKIDISSFNTVNVIDMERMFSSCSNLSEINLASFRTPKVTDMSYMFSWCSTLEKLDLSKFTAVKVSNLNYMFYQCNSLASLDLANFDTSACRSMSNMFSGCSALDSLDLGAFRTSRVKNMNSMFYGCSSLGSLLLGSFDTRNVMDMGDMFNGCSALTKLDLSSFRTARVTNMSQMFSSCYELEDINISNFDTSMVKSMAYMFCGCSSLTSINLSGFNTSHVTDMSRMFSSCTSLSYLDLSSFDTSHAVSMDAMFTGNLSSYIGDFSSVTLGPKFSFKGRTVNVLCQLPSRYEWRDGQSIEYTWTNKGKGLTYTAANLAANYNGSTMAGTWTLGNAATTTKDILGATVEVADQVWTGQALRPNVTVKLDGVTLTPDEDYFASYSNNTDPGEAKVTVSGRGNYIGTISKTFLITRDISNATVTAPEQTYTGNPLTPSVTVALDGQTLPSSAYDVDFADNTEMGTAHITVTGRGGYKGQATGTFGIVAPPKPIDLSSATVTVPNAQESWTGSEIKPSATVKLGDDTLSEGTDYEVAYSNNTSAGTATVTITGKGRYTGTAQTTFTIVKADDQSEPDQPSKPDDPGKPDNPDDPEPKTTDVSGASVAIDDQTWTGEPLEPPVTVKLDGATLRADTDYDVAYDSNTEVGAATVTITGRGSYSGTVSKVFNIRPVDLSTATVTADAQTWNGAALAPAPVVTLGDKTLPADAYIVTYENNCSVGTATVKVTGQGHYAGTAKGSFEIGQADISTASVFVANQIYTGEAIEPTTIVTLGRTVLDPGTDYEASFANNTNPGVATVTLTGKGNCTGEISAEFRIVEAIRARDLSGAKVTAAAKRWTGAALQPDVVVTLDDNTEVPADGYTVECSNNTNVGQAQIKVTGKDTTGRVDFYGEAYGTFDILPTEIEGAQINVEDPTWDGKPLTPATTVRLGDTELSSGTDYDVSYVGNDAPGTATVTVTGKGNYTGTASRTFEIKAPDKSRLNEVADEAAGLVRGTYTEASWDTYQKALAAARAVLGNSKSTQSEVDTALKALQEAKDELQEEPSAPEPNPEPTPEPTPEPEEPQHPQVPTKVASKPMYRLYNSNSGEHFYTPDASERDNVVAAGWRYEGVGWNAPESGDPVFRLYNSNAGDHHYTMNASERDTLIAAGWNYEGVGWYSSTGHQVPLYRQYNPNAQAGSHNYTTDKSENDNLVSLGWRAEGIGWYGV